MTDFEIGREHYLRNEYKDAIKWFTIGTGKGSCSCKLNDRFALINSVYTFPNERRKHYAQNLVYRVTRKVSDMGYIPMLYTDADYKASNNCYENIGYILRGKICTIELKL